ncbi:MAG: beta-galactosidase [Armatimonadota bacterium]
MYVGVDYYPEHWPRERWDTDARLMQEAGFNVVRLAEFAWVNMEPMEGRFEFGWLDDALSVLGKHSISVILCTPTAVMPAWVPRKYPEVMAMGPAGARTVWGVRKNNCFTSGTYRLLSERITRAMADHFKDAPGVIGWQTDNEFGGPVCFCETCRADFQDWLRAKYGTLEELNARWGTHFWGQKYTTWGEIQIPSVTFSGHRLAGDGHLSTHNPSLCLDWQRYYSHLNVRFQADQVRILRQLCPKHSVTHNFMGLFSDLDYYKLAEDLDHVSWDNYPVWGKPGIPYNASAAAAVMRGLKRKNFWIMEQTAGPGGWSTFGRNPRPGEIRKIAYQQLANGADGMIWFRWRSCTAGREQYWHGLLQHDGKPLRRYREAAQYAREQHSLAGELAGTTVKSQVAIIYDYDSIWALRIQPGFVGNSYHAAMGRYFAALFRAGVNVDMIKPTEDFSQYRAVIAPDFHVVPDTVAKALSGYVAKGGVLLADCRLAVKDETNLCYDRTLPGLLSEALGIAIEEYEAIDEGVEHQVIANSPLSGEFAAVQYVDWVTPEKAEALAAYGQWHLAPFAAVTRNRFGKGTGYYVGAVVKEESFYDQLIAEVLRTAKVSAPLAPPLGVEASVREGEGRKLLFLVNHTEETKTIAVPKGKKELLSGNTTGDTLELGRYEVAVVKLE